MSPQVKIFLTSILVALPVYVPIALILRRLSEWRWKNEPPPVPIFLADLFLLIAVAGFVGVILYKFGIFVFSICPSCGAKNTVSSIRRPGYDATDLGGGRVVRAPNGEVFGDNCTKCNHFEVDEEEYDRETKRMRTVRSAFHRLADEHNGASRNS